MQIVETSAKFQKPGALAGREIVIECPDMHICADEMKMVTVWMNLIGNALKYSDGEVRVEWRSAPDEKRRTSVGNGGFGQGHARHRHHAGAKPRNCSARSGACKRTRKSRAPGLGLLSVQKIVEAHGGETFIEGFKDGAPASGPFTTAQGTYPAMLHGEFRTAFVATCPLARLARG